MKHFRSPSTASRRGFVLICIAAFVQAPARAAEFRELSWDDLVPKDWDPMKSMKDMGAVSDFDPRALKMYDRLREIWDNAPTVPALAGQAIRIAGYLVPLDEAKDGIREFLLVPYFGACIHSPPPPANQIVHVRTQAPVKGLHTMDAIWVSGTLGMDRSDSNMGVSGYTMIASHVTPYKGK